ncbi:MAG: hypothetical protein K2J80_02320 [Oscillospiraceae bacterium]|nr:hypothetical protein [Oscillospiraceae bacterium]
MFGFFKKNKEPEISIYHEDMGKLSHDKSGGAWYGKYMISIFGETAEIDLTVYPDCEDDDAITPETEEAFRYYCQNRDDINEKIERELRNEYQLDDEFVMSSRFKPLTLILLVDGDCGLAIHDLEFPKGWEDGEKVVTILPKVEFYGPEKEYPY